MHRTYVYDAVMGHFQREDIVAEQSLARLLHDLVLSHPPCPCIYDPDAVRERTHPQVIPVKQKRLDIAEIPARTEKCEPFAFRIEMIQPRIFGSYPQASPAVRADLAHSQTAESPGSPCRIILSEIRDSLRQIIDAAEECSQPYSAVPVPAY